MGAPLLANARMYAVTPSVEAAWQRLFAEVARIAGVPLAYLPHPAPAPLEELWRRPGLGLAFMCGWPFAALYQAMRPIAAPVPADPRFGGRPLYATDFVVRSDSGFEGLVDTFGGRIGWTAEHSQSGFNAVRHHLLAFRSPERLRLYAEAVGPLVTPRAVVAALAARRIEVGPLDAYWHALLRRHEPATAAALRVVATTVPAPIPLLVASPDVPAEAVARLRAALLASPGDTRIAPILAELGLAGFASVERDDYAPLADMAAACLTAGYAAPG